MWEKTVGEHQHQTVLEWAAAFFGSMEALLKEQVKKRFPSKFKRDLRAHIQ